MGKTMLLEIEMWADFLWLAPRNHFKELNLDMYFGNF